jgi:hypothetical protein
MSLVQLPPSTLNRSSRACSVAITSASRAGPSPGAISAQIRCWFNGCSTGRLARGTSSWSRYSLTFISGVRDPDAARTTSKNLGGNSFIITPPFSPSAIWVTSCGTRRPASSIGRRPVAS